MLTQALLAALEFYHDGELSLEEIVLRTAHNPARRYRVAERGFLREGDWADLVLVDTNRPTPVTRARVLSQCGWSPFEGETFRSSIVATLVNGQVVYRDGKVIEARAAMRLQIGPQRER